MLQKFHDVRKFLSSHSQTLELSVYNMLQLTSFICKFFLNSFPTCLSPFFSSFSCKSMSHSDCSALHGVNPSFKKMLKNDQRDMFLIIAHLVCKENHSKFDPSPSLSMQMQAFNHTSRSICTYYLQTPQSVQNSIKEWGNFTR